MARDSAGLLSSEGERRAWKIPTVDPSQPEEWYALLSETVRAILSRRAGIEFADDGLHEVLVIVLETIRDGGLRDPGKVLGFARTVANRRAVAHIRQAMFRRRRFVDVDGAEPLAPLDHSPEAHLARRERRERATQILGKLGARDREILERFYLEEQCAEQICGEMRLTGTQFRLFKSRAIAKCSSSAARVRFNPPARSGSRSA